MAENLGKRPQDLFMIRHCNHQMLDQLFGAAICLSIHCPSTISLGLDTISASIKKLQLTWRDRQCKKLERKIPESPKQLRPEEKNGLTFQYTGCPPQILT